ncbi:MAG: glycosyltransferase family 2 protein [Pikeienuella sp.]
MSAPLTACLIACVRDEGPFIAEWVAYHRAIGFSDVLIWSNDCSDGSEKLLGQMHRLGLIRHFPQVSEAPQRDALTAAMAQPEFQTADVAMTLDIDEYLSIRTGAGRLEDLLAAAPGDAWSICEAFFAPCADDNLDGLTIERHPDRERLRRPRHPIKRGVKTLFRPQRGITIGVHRPVMPPVLATSLTWRDGSGQPVGDDFATGARHGLKLKDGHRLATINHYALRSPGAFAVKRARGDAWHPAQRRFTGDYWRKRQGAKVQDDAIGKWAMPVRDTLKQWRADRWFTIAERAARAGFQARMAALSPQIRVVTCIKNEGAFLLEWIAWHRWLGVTDFLVYTNDCDDGVEAMLDALPDVRRIRNPAPPDLNRQFVAFEHARQAGLLTGTDWVISLDVDEFLSITAGAGRLPDLIAESGGDLISVPERLFGAAGRVAYERGRITAQFTRTQAAPIGPKPIRRGVKTMFRPGDHIAQFRTHRPILTAGAWPDWRDGSGAPVAPEFPASDENGFDARGRMSLAAIHHYTTRALEDFVVKSARGDVVFPERRLGARYWRLRNADAVDEKALVDWPAAASAILDDLLADPVLAPLHEAACAAHEAKIAALRADPAYADLWALLD